MSGLVLGPIIGKLGGGAEVNTIPVDFVSSSGTGVKHVVDVPIPDGATARVVVIGVTGTTSSYSFSMSRLMIGGATVGYTIRAFAGERAVTGPTVVEVNRRDSTSNGDPSFVGTVYWWEVPNE